MTLDLSALPGEQRSALREELRLNIALRDAQTDPKALINEVRYFDPVTQLWVEFKMFPPEGWDSPIRRAGDDLVFETGLSGAQDWLWQAAIIDWLHDPSIHSYLVYKARQLGLTLLACGYALWLILMRPGVNCAAYSYEETEAQKLTQAVWDMLKSLPAIFREHVEVVTPQKGAIPGEWIRLRHRRDASKRLSTFQALPATGLHGHGGRISFSIQDELARQRYGRQIYEAITPAVLSRGGKWIGISTANGVSNPETGEGNFFHHLYDTRKEKKISYIFLPWNAEPTRDDDWYENVALKLPTAERNRQYPLNEADGFMLSGFTYFDAEVLAYYRQNVKAPLMFGQFFAEGFRKAIFRPSVDGIIQILEKPKEGAEYVLGVDTSTGRAEDYTSADVLDAASGAPVAHLHAKVEAPRAAFQIHYLGRLYNTAKLAVERGGGYGEALITALRDGSQQLPRYPNLYRFAKKTKPGAKPSEEYGFPMNVQTRPLVLEALKFGAFEHRLPWVSQDHLYEMGTFVHKETSPSPRAEDGCNDDCVMSLALAWHLYETYGDTPARELRRKTRVRRSYEPGPVRAGV
jgi:hypothetical protein